MAKKITIAGKTLRITLLVLGVLVFIWNYIAVHPRGPLLDYRVETARGSAGAVIAVDRPDSETFFNGNEGYAWEIKPVSISGR